MHLTSRRHRLRPWRRQARFFPMLPQIRQKGGHRPPFCPRGVPYTTSPIRSVRRIGSEDVRHIPSPPCPECCRRAIGRERLRQARRPAPNRQSQPFVRLNGALRRRGAVRLNSRHTLCSLHSARPNPRCFCPNRRQPQRLKTKQFQRVRSREGGGRYVMGTEGRAPCGWRMDRAPRSHPHRPLNRRS